MTQSNPLLAQILTTKLIPWMQNGLSERVLVCNRQRPAGPLSASIQVTPCSVRGPRVLAKNGHQYSGKRGVIARWPNDALNEVIQPRFICVLSGRVRYQVSDYIVECNAGHVLVIPSGVPHSDASRTCAAQASSGCELLYLIPFPNSIQCWLDRFSATTDEVEPIGNFMILSERFSTTYRIMMEEIIEQGDAESKIATGLMDAFLGQLQRFAEANQFVRVNFTDRNYSSDSPLTGIVKLDEADFITTLQNYVYAHIHEPITIDVMAKMMYQSRPQFTRRIRRETGLSFVEFLTKCRIEEAKRLLRETPWGISVIAQCVGIKPSYFAMVFCRQTGMVPSAFREQV